MIKNLLFLIIVFVVLYFAFKSDKPSDEKSTESEVTVPEQEMNPVRIQEELDEELEIEERYRRQSKDVKNCVQTLGAGVYRNKPLKFKLNMCNAEE